MPWFLHEPVPGTFVTDGDLDLVTFLNTAHRIGLHVILRPGVRSALPIDSRHTARACHARLSRARGLSAPTPTESGRAHVWAGSLDIALPHVWEMYQRHNNRERSVFASTAGPHSVCLGLCGRR